MNEKADIPDEPGSQTGQARKWKPIAGLDGKGGLKAALAAALFDVRSALFTSFGRRHGGNPIVPERSVTSQTLIIVVDIMSFLTCLTFAAVTIVWQQASDWQNDISREVTIQVRPIDGVAIGDEVERRLRLQKIRPASCVFHGSTTNGRRVCLSRGLAGISISMSCRCREC